MPANTLVSSATKLDDIIENPGENIPAGYHSVLACIRRCTASFTGTTVFAVKDGVSLPEDKLPVLKAKDGYTDAKWPEEATQPITADDTEFVSSATKLDDKSDADNWYISNLSTLRLVWINFLPSKREVNQMKKSLKLASAVILMSQLLIATPFHVLASENSTYKIAKERTETTEMSNSDVTAESSELLTTSSSESSTTSNAESSTTSSSESSTTSNAESSTTSSSESSTTSNAESSTTSSSESSTISSTESSTTSSSTSEITSSKVTKPNHIESSKKEAPKTEGQTKTFSTPQQIESTESFQSQPILSGNEEIHFDKNESVENFIMKIGESARKIGQKYDLYASVMIAQAILESASGQSQLAQAPNYNLFGIKGTYNGNFVIMVTNEDLGNGTLYTTQSKFRVYENYEESFEDYAKLLTKGISGNKDFYAGALKANSKTYREATKFLTGRYATDTQYYLKLNELIKTYDLTNYDKEVKGPQMSKTGYQVPIHNYSITSLFGNRGNEFHRGLDMAATQGEPIHAVKAGKVVKAEFHYSWGNYVVIQHEDGSTALYAHQQQYLVKTGDNVLQGQIIGYVGSTGNSTGPHLHLEICKDSSLSQSMLVDPKTLLFGD
ncbi:hypothetical protein EfmAA242_30060 [Enterococcus faecium]|nr:hypothetical protein EfmAA242_30060 [Enterococcus faecium]